MAATEGADDGPAFRSPLLVLALLTLTAGFADGYALSRYGVFVANQSGNIVHVGMGLVGQDPLWRLSLVAVFGFAVGGSIAWVIARLSMTHRWSVIRTRLFVGAALVLVWWVVVALLPSGEGLGLVSSFMGAIAMGVTATALTRVAGVQAQTSFQSGTVLRSAEALMDWVASAGQERSAGRTLAMVGLIAVLAYAAGGAVGAFAETTLHRHAVLLALVPIVIALVLARGRAQDDALG